MIYLCKISCACGYNTALFAREFDEQLEREVMVGQFLADFLNHLTHTGKVKIQEIEQALALQNGALDALIKLIPPCPRCRQGKKSGIDVIDISLTRSKFDTKEEFMSRYRECQDEFQRMQEIARNN